MSQQQVYDIVTEKIVEKLEQGKIPWEKPWSGKGRPRNLKTGKDYRGINTFVLGCQDFSSPYWLTFNQCRALKGKVKKGSKSTAIVFWKRIEKDSKNPENVEEKQTFSMLKYYRVFNVEQCELPEGAVPEIETETFVPIEKCNTTIENMQDKPAVKHGGNRACYIPSQDTVNMPEASQFKSPEFYYSVMFHELAHSTGAEKRLNRKDYHAGYFGSETYSKEELVAEFTASFLCGVHRIENAVIENSAAYVQSWLEALKNDRKMIVYACQQAQKAADYILGE